jgi:hypothetical protein
VNPVTGVFTVQSRLLLLLSGSFGSRDEVAEVGDAAAMTTATDNVHWFAPKSAQAMAFDVIVDGLDSGSAPYVIQPVDPMTGRHNEDGTISAPTIGFEESMKRYPAPL